MNKKLQKSLALGMAVAFVAPMTTLVNAESKCEIVTTKGNNRYDTAAKLAKNAKNKNVAILINADNSLADGLSASGLAGTLNAPILLTKKDTIPKETMGALEGAKVVYLIGGNNAISKKVENKLYSTGYDIERIEGSNRIETSKNVAKIIENISSKPVTEKYLVNGFKGEADAMSIAPIAAKNEGAIILSNNKDYDKNYKPDYIIGSTSVISKDIENKSGAIRLGGRDRYETNKLVINKFYKDVDNFNVAKGNLLVDALTASAAKQPIVLASEKSDKSVLKGAKRVNLIGGLSDSIVNQIKNIVSDTKNDLEDKSSLSVGNDYGEIMRCEKFPFEQYNIKATDIDGTDITNKVKWIGTGGPDENPLHEIDTRVAGGFPIEFYVTLKDGRVLHKPAFLAIGTDYYSDYPLLTADYPKITVPVGYNLTLKDFGLFCWDTGYGNITDDITVVGSLPNTDKPGTYKFSVECINKDFCGSTLELTVNVK
ncbi:cell wall-binding repeat-containing protein [Peptacetobacter sp.]|uniref:cell wall-binding repeat-containing protein n=1 Tax=Peptacetobacter sp. TaxID=2991975 RepID=UPI00261A157F|nr:cell wall-binding repeat-containing protein [Peptacetobacter sp.]